MSNFNKFVCSILKFYNYLIIVYEIQVTRQLKSLYNRIYRNSIVKIVEYDTLTFNKHVLLDKRMFDIIRDCYQAVWLNRYSYKTTSISVSCCKTDDSCMHIAPIFEVTCWDGKKYYSRGHFDIQKRTVYGKRHKCIHASVKDVLDVTKIVNQHPESFTNDNAINIDELLSIMYMDGLISSRLFIDLLRDEDKFLYVIDDDTLDVRTFKDNEQILL